MRKQRHLESEVGRRPRSRSHGSSGLFGLLYWRRHSIAAALVLTALLGVWLLLSSVQVQAQESEPSLILAAYNMPVEGGAAADLVVALDRPAGPDGVTVNFTVSGGTATRGTDYTMKHTTVEIAPGTSAAANVITPIDDAAYEGDETIILVAEAPSLTLTSNTLTLTIGDNKLPPNSDREALVAIYNATNGSYWLRKHNWLSDKPIRLWEGVDTDHNNRVTELYLSGNRLSRKIPWEPLTQLTELSNLILNGNQLIGSIPPELGRLTNLVDIRLHDNRLSGSIPSELGSLTNLETLYLHGNQLTGSIPPELSSLAELQILDLDGNQLSGSIPSELGSLTNLESLDLEGNQLTGPIPWEHLIKLANLTGLELNENQLSGSIPSELGSLTNLEVLHLTGNQLTGSIPSELGSLTNLESLYLGNNQLTGSIPSELGSLTNLEYLHLEENQMSGSIPPELGNLTNLIELRLHSNQLSGSIPSELDNLTNLETFYLHGNRLNGCVPRSLTSASFSVMNDEGISWCEVEPGPDSPAGVPTSAALIAKMKDWRNDPCCVSDKEHTDRWDRALLAFGETVSDTTLTPLTAAEAQEFTDRGWTRWVEVTAALRELESGGQQDPPNSAPTVSAALGNVTIVSESGTKQVSLSGVFSDADNDALTITVGSSDEAKATVSVAAGGSSLTVTAKARGTATITVTADDGNGGTVSDTFTAKVKAAPVVASAISDLSLELGGDQDISLSDVFSDDDDDALTFTTVSSDDAVVSAFAFRNTLTIAALAEGTVTVTVTVTAQDTDGNRVGDAFDVSVVATSQPPTPTPTPTPESTPTPEPTPTPTPEPEQSTLTGAAARYDVNGDGAIDASEYQQAVRDYAAGKITHAEMLEVTLAAFGGG